MLLLSVYKNVFLLFVSTTRMVMMHITVKTSTVEGTTTMMTTGSTVVGSSPAGKSVTSYDCT